MPPKKRSNESGKKANTSCCGTQKKNTKQNTTKKNAAPKRKSTAKKAGARKRDHSSSCSTCDDGKYSCWRSRSCSCSSSSSDCSLDCSSEFSSEYSSDSSCYANKCCVPRRCSGNTKELKKKRQPKKKPAAKRT